MSVRVSRRPESGFYGLVVQKGPWRNTRVDKQRGGGYQADNKEIISPYVVRSGMKRPLSIVASRIVKDEPVLISNSGYVEDYFTKKYKSVPGQPRLNVEKAGQVHIGVGPDHVGDDNVGDLGGGGGGGAGDDDDSSEFFTTKSYPSLKSPTLEALVPTPIDTDMPPVDLEVGSPAHTYYNRFVSALNDILFENAVPGSPVTPVPLSSSAISSDVVENLKHYVEDAPVSPKIKKELRAGIAPLSIIIPQQLQDNQVSQQRIDTPPDRPIANLAPEFIQNTRGTFRPPSSMSSEDRDSGFAQHNTRGTFQPPSSMSTPTSSGSNFSPSGSEPSPTTSQINREFRTRRCGRGRGRR